MKMQRETKMKFYSPQKTFDSKSLLFISSVDTHSLGRIVFVTSRKAITSFIPAQALYSPFLSDWMVGGTRGTGRYLLPAPAPNFCYPQQMVERLKYPRVLYLS